MSKPVAVDAVDAKSLLVEVQASHSLGALESELATRGFTLGLAMGETVAGVSVGEWIACGAPGSASMFADPSDHLIAGLEATLPNGKHLVIRPGPRRAVGPDLTALFCGARGRFGHVVRVWLRIHPLGTRRPTMPLPGVDLDPEVTAGEARVLAQIEQELRTCL